MNQILVLSFSDGHIEVYGDRETKVCHVHVPAGADEDWVDEELNLYWRAVYAPRNLLLQCLCQRQTIEDVALTKKKVEWIRSCLDLGRELAERGASSTDTVSDVESPVVTSMK